MPDRKRHILILPKWYPNPKDLQLGIFVQNQAILISELYNVTVLFVQGIPDCPKPFITKVIKHNGITEIRVYFQQSSFLSKIQNILKYKKAQKMGLQLITTPIDLVHVQVPIRPFFLAYDLLTKKNIPYIVTEHWSGHLNGQYLKKTLFYKKIYKKVLKKAAAISAVSEPLAQEIEKIVPSKIKIIPNYIIASSIQIKKRSDQKTEIITVSDLNNETKNLLGLIDGFKFALTKDESLFLTIIGDGPDKDLITNRIIEEGLEKNIELLGRKTQIEVINILPEFHYYICNSNVETFGMSIAEAILAGLPVVCTRCGGPEQFVNNNNGILVDVNDSESLGRAIITMSKTYKTYNSAENQLEIEKQFGEKTVLQKWEMLFNSILSE